MGSACERAAGHARRWGVIEVNAPGAYTTPDIDLVVEQVDPKGERVASVFRDLGFVPSGARHWVRAPDLMVEVPGVRLEVPHETRPIGPLELRLVYKEVVLVERAWWASTRRATRSWPRRPC